ncbi:MAG: twin-arginine translocase TatA/TatE family subunit [Gemmatimonadota bacterium]
MPGFGSVGVWEVILILAVLLLVFGAKRLPEIGSALGKGIREFKGSVREIESEINRPSDRTRGDLPRSEAPRAESPPREERPREVDSTRPTPEKPREE